MFISKPSNASKRRPCGTPLLRKVGRLSSVSFQPFKLCFYQSLKDGVSRLLRREGFLEKCEKWRDWNKILNHMSDIYDGKVWKDFSSFLSIPIVGVYH